MKETLISFLENVAKGMYGTTKLTHDDVTNFMDLLNRSVTPPLPPESYLYSVWLI